jgi:hypothetical protein
MPDTEASTTTPWWGRALAGVAIAFALPSLLFPVAEVLLDRRGLQARPGGTPLDMLFLVTGLFGPFTTIAAVLLGLIVLVAPRIRIGLRVATAAIVAASVPATLHILKAFTSQFR